MLEIIVQIKQQDIEILLISKARFIFWCILTFALKDYGLESGDMVAGSWFVFFITIQA